jgi:uncharacterized membrane protein
MHNHSYVGENFSFNAPDIQESFQTIINQNQTTYVTEIINTDESTAIINNSFSPNENPEDAQIQHNIDYTNAQAVNSQEAINATIQDSQNIVIEIIDAILGNLDQTVVTHENPFPNQLNDLYTQ